MKGFADAKKPKIELLADIQKHVVAEGIKNAGVGREDHKIHVSELLKDTMCPRMLYYKISKAERTDAPAPAFHRMEMIWTAGHDVHHKWQRWLREMGDLWGTWTCLNCGHREVGLSLSTCTACKLPFLRYDEVELEDDDYLIVGHADGAVPRLGVLVEVKSFALGTVRIESPELVKQFTVKTEDGKSIVDLNGMWAAIKRPFRTHLRQGMFYLWMCKRMGLPYEKIIFIYENKTTQATKTFEVGLTERFIQEYLDVITPILTASVAPPRPALFDRDSKPCKDCVFRTGCWGEVDDDGSETSAVSAGGSRSRSQEADRGTTVQRASTSRSSAAGGTRRHHRTGRPGTDRHDDAADQVGGAPGGATRVRRGGRALGRRSDGEREGSRFPRIRQGRDGEEGQGI